MKKYERDCEFSEAYEDYFDTNVIERYKKQNILFVDSTLKDLAEYLILPTIINRNFKKFIEEFFSAHTSFILKRIEKVEEIYIVTVQNLKENKIEKIILVLKNYSWPKLIGVNIVHSVKRSIKKYKADMAIIVSVANRLSDNSLKEISSRRGNSNMYNVYYIDRETIFKNTSYLYLKKSD